MTIAKDTSTPAAVGSSGATTTTAAFTPPSSCVIVAFAQADANNGSSDEALTVSDSASGTWNTAVQGNANGGAVAGIYWRLCATSPGSMTVSVTDNKGSVAKRLVVVVFTGTDQTTPIGATVTGATAAVSYTSTRDLSWGWSCGLTANATLTAGGSGNTLYETFGGFDSGDAVFTLQKTATTTPSGSTVTLTIAGTSTIGHHVAVELMPPSSGSNFTKSLAGGMTPAGALTKAASKLLAGGFTPAGTVARQAQKFPAGGMTPAGTVARQAAKALSGALGSAGVLARLAKKFPAGGLTPSGALSNLKVVLLTLSGGMTPSGALTRLAKKFPAGGFTPSGTVARLTSKALAGALTPVGTVRKLASKALAGLLASAGALTRSVFGSAVRASSTPTVTANHSSDASVTARRTSSTTVEGD